MNTFKSTDEILDFAMNGEQAAVDLYTRLANNSENTEIRDMFSQFAKEEMGHKAKLMRIKSEGIFETHTGMVIDLKISDYMADVVAGPDMDYREALIFAMSNEKAAFKLYTRLSKEASSTDLQNIFLNLAQEEAKHKLRFELEYDEYVLREN